LGQKQYFTVVQFKKRGDSIDLVNTSTSRELCRLATKVILKEKGEIPMFRIKLGFLVIAVLFSAVAYSGEPGVEQRPVLLQAPASSTVPQVDMRQQQQAPVQQQVVEKPTLPPPPRYETVYETVYVCRTCCRRPCCCHNVLDVIADKTGRLFDNVGECIEDGFDCVREKSKCLAPKKRFCFFVSNVADGISQPFLAAKEACSHVCDEKKSEREECGFFKRTTQLADVGETMLVDFYRAPVGALTYHPDRLCSGPVAE